MKVRLLLVLQCTFLLNACASLTQFQPEKYQSSERRSCAELFVNLEQTVSTNGVIDSEAARITNYPYLRVNRFLSDFRNDPMDDNAFNTWLDHMQYLAMQGWQIETNNLPPSERKKLTLQAKDIFDKNINLAETLNYCAGLLRSIDLDEKNERVNLKTKAIVPDEYKTWQRVVGLYPITALAFRSGIDRWHEETKKIFAQPLKTLPIDGELIRYTPSMNNFLLSIDEISQIIKNSSKNELKIPELSTEDKQKLFSHFAPIFEIDTVTNNDRIGVLAWDDNNIPEVRTDLNKVYRHLSYTRLHDQILLQLNYTIWFPSRPKTSDMDMLGGHLDGITWRVTLLPDGNPLLFDTIHNCGCYHLFFPTQYAKILPQEPSFEEHVFIPQVLHFYTEKRPVIRIEHGSHYIERVYFDDSVLHNIISYQFADSNELRSLPIKDNKYRSVFGQDGIIQSSQRGERYLFWPMGIPEPGAMRQWGHHATAFVGRRHFDDARLFEKYFDIDTAIK